MFDILMRASPHVHALLICSALTKQLLIFHVTFGSPELNKLLPLKGKAAKLP